MKSVLARCSIGLPFAVLATSAAFAQPVPGSDNPAAQPMEQSASALEISPLFATAPIADDATLNAATAREDVSLVAETRQASSVSNSSVSGVTTSKVELSDSAFQNASGLIVVNANTGNNVAMNGSVNVNIVMTPPQQ